MKIEQKTKFQPITITLETEAEAQAVWDAVLAFEAKKHQPQIIKDTMHRISNWFSNHAQL